MVFTPGNSQHADSPNYAGSWAVGFIIPLFATFFLGLRLLAKSQTKHKWAADDMVLTVALLFVWAMCGTFLYGVSHGGIGGHSMLNPKTHELMIGPHDFVLQVILFYFFIFERVSFGLIKIGVVLWYRLVFIARTFNILSITLLGILATMSTAFLFTTIFQCGSDPSIWWSGLQEELAKCVDTSAVVIAFSAIDLFTDVCVITLPIPYVWRLQMSFTKKLTVLATFGLGLLSTAAAVARLFIWCWILYDVDLNARDFQGLTTQGLVCSVISAGAALTGACLPALHPLTKTRAAESIINSARKLSKSKTSSKETLAGRPTADISGDLESSNGDYPNEVVVHQEISVVREKNDGTWRKKLFGTRDV